MSSASRLSVRTSALAYQSSFGDSPDAAWRRRWPRCFLARLVAQFIRLCSSHLDRRIGSIPECVDSVEDALIVAHTVRSSTGASEPNRSCVIRDPRHDTDQPPQALPARARALIRSAWRICGASIISPSRTNTAWSGCSATASSIRRAHSIRSRVGVNASFMTSTCAGCSAIFPPYPSWRANSASSRSPAKSS